VKRKNKLPELLAPAGSFECLIAAIKGGADAIYIGGKRFGARAYAKNFDIEEIKRAVRYAHLHERKIYVTLNTLILDKEMPEVLSGAMGNFAYIARFPSEEEALAYAEYVLKKG
jgi:putative protease